MQGGFTYCKLPTSFWLSVIKLSGQHGQIIIFSKIILIKRIPAHFPHNAPSCEMECRKLGLTAVLTSRFFDPGLVPGDSGNRGQRVPFRGELYRLREQSCSAASSETQRLAWRKMAAASQPSLSFRFEESMWNFPTLLARVCVLKEIPYTGEGREARGPALPAGPLPLWPQGPCSSRGHGFTASGSLFLAGVWRLGSLCPLRAGRASSGRAACQRPAATLAASAEPVDSDLSGSLAR